MATQVVSAEQLVISLNSDLLAQLQDSAAKFGYESSAEVGAEVIKRYLASWIASKEAGTVNRAEPHASGLEKTAIYNEATTTIGQNNGQENGAGWSLLHEQWLAQMMADPGLTEAQKQELLRQSELPDDEWEPIQLPAGTETLAETVIKMRRGE